MPTIIYTNQVSESKTREKAKDPRKRYLPPAVGEKRTARGILEEDEAGGDTGRSRKARYSEIPDLIEGDRVKRAAEEAAEIEKDRAFIVDYNRDMTHSSQQTAALATAQNEAEETEKEMVEDMEGGDVISAFNTEDFERPAYDAKQRAIMADVRGGGCGTIFVGQRGDFQIARWVLNAKNKQNKARFRYMSATRRIEDPAMVGEWKDFKKILAVHEQGTAQGGGTENSRAPSAWRLGDHRSREAAIRSHRQRQAGLLPPPPQRREEEDRPG